jgi:hypothetical protein
MEKRLSSPATMRYRFPAEGDDREFAPEGTRERDPNVRERPLDLASELERKQPTRRGPST